MAVVAGREAEGQTLFYAGVAGDDSMGALRPSLADSIQPWIDATDAEIDRLVYELYGLTDDEIQIVEEEARKA
ncbi:MAG: hypothetical protein QM570_15535 [Planctomycetota bacterium]|nr:hypothetical protein [Planctomycetota bacterium]